MASQVGIEFDIVPFVAGVEQDLGHVVQEVEKGVEEIAQGAASDMKRLAAGDHALAASISVTKGRGFWDVGTSFYRAVWREFGTGVWNPQRKAPIVPRGRKKALAGGLAHPVEQVAGMHPHPFFRPALTAAMRRFNSVLK